MHKLLKNKLFLFGLVLAALAVGIMIYAFVSPSPTPITNLLGAIVTPMEQGVSFVGDKVRGLFDYFKSIDALKEENQDLKIQLAQYRMLESEYYEAILENEELRALAELKQQYVGFDLEMCTVVSTVTRGFMSSFTVNAGTADGIENGDCVITDLGFVGYISSAGLNNSEVVTLINVQSKVAADIARTRETVIAEGNFELSADGKLKIPYLKNDSDVQIGDVVETSSVGEKYPKGLILGTVTELRQENHGISSYAIVEPAVSFHNLHTVYVIKDFEVVE